MDAVKKKNIKYLIIIIVIFLVIVMLNCLYFFVLTPIKVSGPSMEDTYYDGDIIIINKVYGKIDRNDIVVFYYNGLKVVKRVIGIATDTVSINESKLYVNGEFKYDLEEGKFSDKNYFIQEGEFFVIGDNINNSYDSRYFGKITKEDIIGVISF